jgi:hypothetical protein
MDHPVEEFAWGDFETNQKGEIVTNFGAESGYRCPICHKSFNTKRKDTMRKHLVRLHEYMSRFPSFKERCQLCDIPLDPSKDKRIIHLETCAGNIEEGDNVVEEVEEIDYDDVELDETEEIEGVTASEGDGESKGDGEIGMDIKTLVEDKEISLEIDDDNDHLEEENVYWQVKEDNQHEGVGEDNLDENNNLE